MSKPEPKVCMEGEPPTLGVLRDADVAHSDVVLGRGGSGIKREGTLQQVDGTIVKVAIKELAQVRLAEIAFIMRR